MSDSFLSVSSSLNPDFFSDFLGLYLCVLICRCSWLLLALCNHECSDVEDGSGAQYDGHADQLDVPDTPQTRGTGSDGGSAGNLREVHQRMCYC